MKQVKFLLIIMILSLIAAGCQRRPTSTADVPRLVPTSYRIAVAPFTQPLHPGQLISGQLPEFQGKISEESLLDLDLRLRDALRTTTKRTYTFLPAGALPKGWSSLKSTGQPSALNAWLSYGKEHGTELLLVPQVLDWHEREGSKAGVTRAAAVRVEFYLLNITQGAIIGRSVFEEQQVGLIDNLLTMPEFVRRKGQWVTAAELASDGMAAAIKELGL